MLVTVAADLPVRRRPATARPESHPRGLLTAQSASFPQEISNERLQHDANALAHVAHGHRCTRGRDALSRQGSFPSPGLRHTVCFPACATGRISGEALL